MAPMAPASEASPPAVEAASRGNTLICDLKIGFETWRKATDSLIAIYWETVYSLYPILDEQEFITVYESL